LVVGKANPKKKTVNMDFRAHRERHFDHSGTLVPVADEEELEAEDEYAVNADHPRSLIAFADRNENQRLCFRFLWIGISSSQFVRIVLGVNKRFFGLQKLPWIPCTCRCILKLVYTSSLLVP
jgi:hypothetical protein